MADCSRACAYVRGIGRPGYDPVREWDSLDARTNSAALGEDKPGRVFAGKGVSSQRSAIEGESADRTPKGHAKRDFEHKLPMALTHAHREGMLSELYLVAPAPMQHRLRDGLPPDLRRDLVGELPADLTQRPMADLFAVLDRLRNSS